MDEVLRTAKSCRHYAMCKIDFLGSGVCASGLSRRYVAFYPQGRMHLYASLVEKKVAVTRMAVEIADSCDVCGRCDYQCFFVTGMRPSRVMTALKDFVRSFLASGGVPEIPEEDDLLRAIREITGEEWATNDPGVRIAYSHDPCVLAAPTIPEYVVMPGSRDEVSALMKLFRSEGIRWVIRGNGTNVLGAHLSEGVVLDMNRMNDIEFDEKNWIAKVGPGVTAFDLQREAVKRGFRVNVAEPAALVCGSMMSCGILSLFATSCGTSADNYVTAEFVSGDGNLFSTDDLSAPNIFGFNRSGRSSPGICTSLEVRLHPMTGDETGLLVPFRSMKEAVEFASECALRRIGLAVGVLGAEYVSSFIAPTLRLAAEAREAFERRLGMNYLVVVLGDGYAMRSVAEMGRPVIDQRLFRFLSLGLASLSSAQWLDLAADLEQGEDFAWLGADGLAEFVETALCPSAESLCREIDPELREFFRNVYSRPETTDLFALNLFRITSSRIGREKHFLPLLMYLPPELIPEMCRGLKEIAARHGVVNDFGFAAPVDAGRRCIFEYDFFTDLNDPDEASRTGRAFEEAAAFIEDLSATSGTIRWLRYVSGQSFARLESILYA